MTDTIPPPPAGYVPLAPDSAADNAPAPPPGYVPLAASRLPSPQAGAPTGRSATLTFQKSAPTPDADTWFGRRIQDFEGKHDPAYADTPSIYSQFPDELKSPTATAALLGASDPQMADIIKAHLGDKFLGEDTDANGYPIFITKNDKGEPQAGYVNKPGLDSEDLWRATYGAAPYMLGAGVIGSIAKKLGMPAIAAPLLRIIAAPATSIVGDEAQKALGSQQGIEGGKAATMMLAAGLGEALNPAVSSLYQKFIAIPSLFDKSTGQLTQKGLIAAQKMGLDPQAMTNGIKQEFAKTYAMNPQATGQMVDRINDAEFNIPSTVGQRSKDPEQLMLEKNLRYGTQGLEAKTVMQGLDQTQNDAVNAAVRQQIPSRLAGQPLTSPLSFRPGDYGQRIADSLDAAKTAAKGEERAAWDNTAPLTAKTVTTTVPDAMTPITGAMQQASSMAAAPLLKGELAQNLGPYASVISPDNTPTAYRMWSYLNDFMGGKKPSSALHSSLGLSPSNDVDSVRKAIGLMSRDAQTATDKMVSGKIYDAYNSWLGKAADQGLLHGDMAAVTAFRGARDITKEMNTIFKPQVAGKLTPGGKILEKIEASGDVTPEHVITALFGSPKAAIKAGAVEALQRIKTGLQRYLQPGQVNQAWNDIRLAHWASMTQGGNGEIVGYQMMKENLKNALHHQDSLLKMLYSPSELSQMQRFVKQLEKITYKDPNPSGSASGLGAMVRQFANKLLDVVPHARTAFEWTGMPEHRAAAIAKRAVSQTTPFKSQPSLPVVSAAATALANSYARNKQ